MKHSTQVELIKRVFALYEAKSTSMGEKIYRNPVSDYTSADQLRLEQKQFFRDYPLVMCLSSQIANPGDYITDELSGVPILVTRNSQGQVRAFLNVCRHRGAQVASGCGHGKKLFVCPYHAWTYDLDGRLRNCGPADAFPDIDADNASLVSLPAAERHGIVWVKVTPGGEIDTDDLFQGLGPEIESYNLGAMHHYQTPKLHKKMNWKLVIDTFLETWHIGTLHRQTVAPIFQPNINVFDAFGRNGRFILPRRSILELQDKPEEEWDLLTHSAIIYLLFPNTLIVWQRDHIETWRSFPNGASTDECIAEAGFYTPEPISSEKAKNYWDKNMALLMATVEDEDFPVCLDIQRGFEANAQSYITFGRNEPGLTHYHHHMRSALGLKEAPEI